MTGYFSQLARHTGLSFARDDNSAPAARIVDAAPAVSAPHADSAPLAPLVVEEIAFSAPAPRDSYAGNDDAGGLRVAGHATNDAPAAAQRGQAEAHQTTDAGSRTAMTQTSHALSLALLTESPVQFTGQAASAHELSQHDAAAQPHAGERRAGQVFDEGSQAAAVSRPQAADTKVEPVTVASALANELPVLAAARREASAQALSDREPSDGAAAEGTTGDASARDYLREIREWVAAPASFVEQQAAELESDVAFALTQAADALAQATGAPPFVPADKPSALAVQDLDLSIGSIQIVIEEPRPAAPAPVAATPRVEHAPAQTTRATTTLSRYYLRDW